MKWLSLPLREDEAALVARYEPMARCVVRRFVAHVGEQAGVCDADEAFSGAMMGVWEAVRTWKDGKGAKLSAYVYRLAHARMLDALRGKGGIMDRYGRLRIRLLADHAPDGWDGDREATPPGLAKCCPMLEAVDEDDAAEALLALVPPGRLRRVFRRYHLDGLRLHEIGAEEGMCESNVSLIRMQARREAKARAEAIGRRTP